MKKACRIFILAVIMSIIIFANNIVKAAQDNFAEVTNLSGGQVDINGSGTANVTLKYSQLSLTWFKADPSIGRTVDGYWVGYRVDFPQGLGGNSASEETVKKAKYHTKFVGYDWSESKSFYDAKDGQWYMTGWVQITQERLDAKQGDFEFFEIEFDWEGDEEFEQNIKISLNAENVELDKSNVTAVTVKESGNGASNEIRNYTIETGKSLNDGLIESELETLQTIKNKEGFVKFYKEGTENEEFSFDEAINESEITIIALFNKPVVEPEPEPELKPDPEKENPPETPTPELEPAPAPDTTQNVAQDETPKTGNAENINFAVAIIASVFVVSTIAIVVLRKNND